MLKIVQNMPNKKETVLNEEYIKKAVQSAVESIKNELPEEAQTIEVMEYIVSEMSRSLKEKKVIL